MYLIIKESLYILIRVLYINILILFLFSSCGNDSNIETSIPKLSLHDYQMRIVNEVELIKIQEDQIRFTVKLPFGMNDNILGIIDLGDEFLVYKKTVSSSGRYDFESKGVLVKGKEFQVSWEKILNILKSKKGIKFEENDEVVSNDNPFWYIETKIGTIYELKSNEMTESDLTWAKEIYSMVPLESPFPVDTTSAE